MEILLATGTRKIDYVATVEHIETISRMLGVLVEKERTIPYRASLEVLSPLKTGFPMGAMKIHPPRKSTPIEKWAPCGEDPSYPPPPRKCTPSKK
jgi:hypothetical protein